MRYKLLGHSGLRVSELALGAMTFGEDWDFGTSQEESRAIFDAFAEAGGNFIDTANAYMNGTSEKLVGEFIRGERDRWVIGTKYSGNIRPGDPNAGGNARKSLTQAIEGSLKRLGTDYIDLLWVHAWDFMTPVEEVVRALDDQVRAGKVLYIGISDAPAWIVAQANTIADLRGWSPFVALQIEYNLVERGAERDLLPMARAFDLAVTPWAPLANGVLTGKYNKQAVGQQTSEVRRLDQGMLSQMMRPDERKLHIAAEVVAVAEEIGRSPAQVALNWLRLQRGQIIPILGARKVSQIKDNLGCLEFELSLEHLTRLDKVSKIELGFPYDYLKSPLALSMIHGGTFERIENSRNPL
jgi:aryl-alcohol dehydrogenase-like predicted oxidoreductase